MAQESITDESKSITMELLERAIRSKEGSDDVVVKDIEVDELALKPFVSRQFHLKVGTEKNGKETEYRLFMKIILDNKIIKQFILVQSKFFEKEKMSYEKIIADMIKFQKDQNVETFGPSVPSYYYGLADSSTGIMILEDVKPHGYIVADRQQGLNYEHCKLAVEELAVFHALSFAIKGKNVENLRKYENLFHEGAVTDPLSPYLTNGLKTSVGLIKMHAKDENIKVAADKLLKMDLKKTLSDLIKPTEPYALICHGDMWSNNILFKYDDGVNKKPIRAKLVDLQIVRYALPTTDLSYFFFINTTRNVRKQHMKTLLQHYHTTFIKSLENLNNECPEFTFQVLEKMFLETAMFGIIFACMLLPNMLINPDGSPSLKLEGTSEVEMERSFVEYFKHVLEIKDNVSVIKDRIIGALEDAIEMGVM